MLVFVLYSRWLFKSMKGFCSFQEVFGRWLVIFLEVVSMCLLCAPFSPFMGKLFNHSSSPMSIFRESQWVQSHYYSYPDYDINYFFGGHSCYPALVAPPSFKPCPSTYFDYHLKHIFVLDRILNHYSPFVFGWAFWDDIQTSFGMVHTKRPILRVFKIIPNCGYYYSWGYP